MKKIRYFNIKTASITFLCMLIAGCDAGDVNLMKKKRSTLDNNINPCFTSLDEDSKYLENGMPNKKRKINTQESGILLPFEDVSKNYQYSIKNNDISNNFTYTVYSYIPRFPTIEKWIKNPSDYFMMHRNDKVKLISNLDNIIKKGVFIEVMSFILNIPSNNYGEIYKKIFNEKSFLKAMVYPFQNIDYTEFRQKFGDPDLNLLLHRLGSDIKKREDSKFDICLLNNIIYYYEKDPIQYDSFIKAIFNNIKIKECLKYVIGLEKGSITPIQQLILSNNVYLLQYLINIGYKCNNIYFYCENTDLLRSTIHPLFWALALDNIQIFKILLSSKEICIDKPVSFDGDMSSGYFNITEFTLDRNMLPYFRELIFCKASIHHCLQLYKEKINKAIRWIFNEYTLEKYNSILSALIPYTSSDDIIILIVSFLKVKCCLDHTVLDVVRDSHINICKNLMVLQ